MTLATIQEQLTKVREKLDQLDANNRDHLGEISSLKTQEAELTVALGQEQEQQQREQKQEEKINGEITFNVTGVDFTKLPAELIQIINIVVKNDRRQIFADHNQEISNLQTDHREEVAGYEEQLLQAGRQNDELQQVVHTQDVKIAELAEQLKQEQENHNQVIERFNQTNARLQEVEQYRSNASRELEDANGEIKRLKDLISNQQASNLFGERQAQTIIDITPEDNLQDLVNVIAAKFSSIEELNKNTDDFGTLIKVTKPDGGFEVFKRDQFEKLQQSIQPIEIPAVQPVTGNSFRDENQENNTADNHPSQVATVTDFRTNGDTTAETADAGPYKSTGGTLAGEEFVSRQEFEALKQRVTLIERHANLPGVA